MAVFQKKIGSTSAEFAEYFRSRDEVPRFEYFVILIYNELYLNI